MEQKRRDQTDIRIYVVCHKETYVPENRYLYPVQAGTSLAGKRLEGMLHDDEGENISGKNRSYCELTVQYWAWKNQDADYYGFFHYRRYLSFDPGLNRDDGWGNIAYDRITDAALKELRLNPEDMESFITNYDVITVKGRRFPRIQEKGALLDVYHEYGAVDFQHREDLDAALEVLHEKYPQVREAADRYMHSAAAHECNMFIMRKTVYLEYCEWLFDILFETEKRIDMTRYNVEEYRVMGYLAERLCGIYYTYLEGKEDVRCAELPKAIFHDTSPKPVLKPVYKDGVPIVLAANNRFAPYLDVTIRSIAANADAGRNYDMIVLCNDITEKNQLWIRTAVRDKANFSLRFVKVDQYFDAAKLFIDQHLSVETYYRLIIPELMPDYHRILYLDCDLVAEDDVAKLYDTDLAGNIVGAAKDIDVAGQVKAGQNEWEKYALEKLGLDSPFDYFQAGVIVIDLDGLRCISTSDELIRMALETSWRCHDQDILNVVCKNKVHYLPQRWNVLMNWEEPWERRSRMQLLAKAPRELYLEYSEARKRPGIVHYAGYQKPWDVADCDFAEYFWKYAVQSPYYPMLVRRITRCFAEEAADGTGQRTAVPVIANLEKEPVIRRIANRFLPYGSRRREAVKKVYKAVFGRK